MSDQEKLGKTPELVLLETIIKSVQEIDQSQPGRVYPGPMAQSNSYGLDSVIQVPYNESPPEFITPEYVGNRRTIKDFWLAAPLFFKRFALGIFAVILGVLLGLITPWLTSGF